MLWVKLKSPFQLPVEDLFPPMVIAETKIPIVTETIPGNMESMSLATQSPRRRGEDGGSFVDHQSFNLTSRNR